MRVGDQKEGTELELGTRIYIYIYIAKVTHVIEHSNSTRIIKAESPISHFLKMSTTYSLVYVLADLSQDRTEKYTQLPCVYCIALLCSSIML